MSDEELARRLKKHDESAMEEIMEVYTPYISTIINNMSKGGLTISDMEEVCADVFITLWKNTEKLREQELKSYIIGIAKSRTIDKLRAVSSKQTIDIEDIIYIEDNTAEDMYKNSDFRIDFEQALQMFSEDDREIIVRYYYYYQTVPKIAAIKGMNKEAVKSKIRRAKSKLESFFRERGYKI